MKKRQYDHEQGMEKFNFPAIELTEEQLEQVNGGLNPQPLPPRELGSFKLRDNMLRRRIIAIGGYRE
ncbi:hypothetical protein [Dictyobacter formicarum]|uniref:Bacteriocin-type signal sequence n=1 Tax=Dictyobacter formicarum TaxID=2778368 RepID=A0ABQ3VST1_9CHLR|nr:hypothetical protein [Dictyobacter formicarum]GHO88443.1 hypothetical protein KSZ_64490 [Dictyobacter formicarum]